LPFDCLSAAVPDHAPGATADDGVELGRLVLPHDAAARITSEKSPRQPTRAESHEV